MPEAENNNTFFAFTKAVVSMVDGPVTWFRGKYLSFSFCNNLVIYKSILIEIDFNSLR